MGGPLPKQADAVRRGREDDGVFAAAVVWLMTNRTSAL